MLKQISNVKAVKMIIKILGDKKRKKQRRISTDDVVIPFFSTYRKIRIRRGQIFENLAI